MFVVGTDNFAHIANEAFAFRFGQWLQRAFMGAQGAARDFRQQ